jgi:hypothetical protein
MTLTFDRPRNIVNIQAYKSTDELKKAHPEVKSWSYIYIVNHGMTVEGIRAAVKQTMQKKGQWYSMVYHVGNFIMAPAIVTDKVNCVCLERIGDNGPYPKHGDPYAHLEGRS